MSLDTTINGCQNLPVRRSLRLRKLGMVPELSVVKKDSIPKAKNVLAAKKLHRRTNHEGNNNADIDTSDPAIETEIQNLSMKSSFSNCNMELNLEVVTVRKNEIGMNEESSNLCHTKNNYQETNTDLKTEDPSEKWKPEDQDNSKMVHQNLSQLNKMDSDINDNNSEKIDIITTELSVPTFKNDDNIELENKVNNINASGINEVEVKNTEIECAVDETKELEEENINSKIDELLLNVDEDSDSDREQNSFLDMMAIECEEDTPSDGSNDIIPVGEKINSTESELSTDESYENNSFIDDEENNQLLSGEEYDISLPIGTKRRRIMEFSSGSDDEIIFVKKNKKKCTSKRKRSRIIRFENSSDEEPILIVEPFKNQKESNKVSSQDGSNNEFKIADHSPLASNLEPRSLTCTSENKFEKQEENGTRNEEWSGNLISPTSNGVPSQNVNNKIIILENIRVQDCKGLSDKVNSILSSLQSKPTSIEKIAKLTTDVNFANVSKNKVINNPQAFDGKNESQIKTNGKNKRRRKKQKIMKTPNFAINENYFKFKPELQSVHCVIAKRKNRKRQVSNFNEDRLDIKRSNKQTTVSSLTAPEGTNHTLLCEPFLLNMRSNKKTGVERSSNGTITGEKKVISQFHSKDFKDAMLYDKKRVRRMGTNQLLKNSIY